MSQHAVYKTGVKIDVDTLVKAIKKLAQEIDADVKNYVRDYYGIRTDVAVALYPRDLPRGIGFNVREGVLTIEGDDYGYKEVFRRYSILARNYINMYKTRKRVYQKYPNAKVKTRIQGKDVIMEVIMV